MKIYKYIFAVCIPYFVFTKITGFGIPCVFRITTGFMCPGCGATRMFAAIAKLNFRQAFYYNPALFLLLPVWNAIAVMCYIGRPSFVTGARFLSAVFYLTVAVMVLFGVMRNFM